MVSRAKESHTTNRVIRVPDDDWTDLGNLVGERQRAQTIRAFIEWYLGRPGAKLPEHPAAPRPKDASPQPDDEHRS